MGLASLEAGRRRRRLCLLRGEGQCLRPAGRRKAREVHRRAQRPSQRCRPTQPGRHDHAVRAPPRAVASWDRDGRSRGPGLPAGWHGGLRPAPAPSHEVTIGLRSAHALDDFVASLTNSPTETKFWGSIQRTLEKASAHTAACSSRAPDCTSLTGLSGELNRIALSAYLQGFLSLATEQCERQLGVLAASPCGCARVSELQPWVNLARLARARQDRAALAEAAAGLAGALESAAAVDPGTLPHDLAEGLGNGSMLGAAQHVETIETAKLEWLACEYAACERLVAPLAPHSGVAMELNVRC